MFYFVRYIHTVYYSSSNDSVNPELHPQSHHNVIHVTDIKQKSRREDGVTVCTSSCLIFGHKTSKQYLFVQLMDRKILFGCLTSFYVDP